MKKIILLIILICCNNIIAQELTCLDFKTGTFYIYASETAPINVKIDRGLDTQIEYLLNYTEIKTQELKEKTFEKIQWIDDCTFRVIYDDSKMELDEFGKFVNSNNGLINKLISIEGKCAIYESSLVHDGKMEKFNMTICKE